MDLPKFPKLKGSSNYDIWSLRASAQLTKEGYLMVMHPPTQQEPETPASVDITQLDQEQQKAYKATVELYNTQKAQYEEYTTKRREMSLKAAALIRLIIEDGPLIQTRYIEDASALWNQLQVLYATKGFVSDFLLIKDLFNTTLANCNGAIEAYLTKIKRLTDELHARGLTIPDKVIAAYTLNKLGP